MDYVTPIKYLIFHKIMVMSATQCASYTKTKINFNLYSVFTIIIKINKGNINQQIKRGAYIMLIMEINNKRRVINILLC